MKGVSMGITLRTGKNVVGRRKGRQRAALQRFMDIVDAMPGGIRQYPLHRQVFQVCHLAPRRRQKKDRRA